MAKQLKVKVARDFERYTPDQKVDFGDEVIDDMSANSGIFTSPDVPVSTGSGNLTDVNNDLRAKTLAAASGDHEKILERDASEVIWISTFNTEGNYVEHVAAGNKIIIAQSGFHSTQSETQAQTRPAKPDLTTYSNRTSGSIHAETKGLNNAKGVLFIAVSEGAVQNVVVADNKVIITLPNGNIILRPSTTRKIDLEGLSSKLAYDLAAVTFNSEGLSDPSTPENVVVP